MALPPTKCGEIGAFYPFFERSELSAAERYTTNESMQDALGHGQRAGAHIDHQQQLALRVHGRPHPIGRALQTRDGLILTEIAVLELAQDGVQLVELQLLEVEIT